MQNQGTARAAKSKTRIVVSKDLIDFLDHDNVGFMVKRRLRNKCPGLQYINTVPTQRQVKLVAISQDALDQATTLITKISGMFFRQLPLSPDILASGPNLHKNKHQTLKRMQHKYSAWLVFLDSVGTLHLIGEEHLPLHLTT